MTPLAWLRRRRLLLALLTLGLALLGAAAIAVLTPLGVRIAAPAVNAFLPDSIVIEGLRGTFARRLQISRLTVTVDGLFVEVQDASVEYTPWNALLSPRELQLDRVQAARVRVEQRPVDTPSPTTKKAFELAAPNAPLDLFLGDASVNELTVTTVDGALLELTDTSLAGAWTATGIEVERLSTNGELRTADGGRAASSPVQFTLTSSGRLAGAADAPSRLDARATVRSDELPRLTLTVDLAGVLSETVDVSVITEGPVSASLKGSTYRLGKADFSADADISLREPLELQRVVTTLPRLLIEGSTALAWQDGSLSVSPRLALELPEAYRLLPAATATLAGKATVQPPEDDDSPARARVANLSLALTPSTSGEEKARAPLTINLTGELTAGRERQDAHIDLALEGFDPALLDAAWPGRLTGSLVADVERTGSASRPVISVSSLTLDGVLRDYPVSVEAVGALAPSSLRIERFEARSGNASASATASIDSVAWPPTDAPLALDLQANIPDLREVLADGSGALTVEATADGTMRAPQISMALEGRALAVGNTLAVDTLTLSASAQGLDALEVNAQAASARIGERRLDSVDLLGSGRLANHSLSLALRGPDGDVEATVAGALSTEERQWQGRIRALRLDLLERRWRLRAGPAAPTDDEAPSPPISPPPATLTVNGDQQQLTTTCLKAQRFPDEICLAARRNSDGLRADASVAQVALAPWAALLAPRAPIEALTGTLDGNATLEFGGAGASQVNGSLRVSPGTLTLRTVTDTREAPQIEWQEMAVTVTTQGGDLSLDARFDLLDIGTASATASVPASLLDAPDTAARLPLAAQLNADLDVPKRLADAFPGVGGLAGEVDIALTARGTLGAPELEGSAELRGFGAQVPDAGITLADGAASLTASADAITLNGSVASGEGVLTADASFERAPAGAWRGELRVKGDRVLALDGLEVRAEISPDLKATVDVAKRLVTVRGEVVIPSARLAPVDLSGAVRTSSDERIVGAMAPQEREDGWSTDALITLRLGDDIALSGAGVSGRLSGELTVRERPGELPIGNGELALSADTTFSAFKQTLAVERGRLVFINTPLANPGVDLRATREVEDIAVHVDVRGTLREQRITISSDPPLPEADALSYLVTGRPLSSLSSGGDTDLLATAVRQTGLAGANLIAQRLGRRLGLDEFTVESDAGGEQTRLVVGQYLSPRLYVRYGLGLFESLSTWLLRYDLSRRWSLETETGAQNSADLLYSIEN